MPEAGSLLTRGWELHRERRYAELADLLAPVAEDELPEEPSLVFLWADTLRRLGDGPRAFAVLEDLAPSFDRLGNDRIHRRRLQLLGTLHFEQGRNDEAARVWRRQLEDSATAADTEFRARANNNLGILSTLATEWAQAISCYGRAVAAYQRLGYARGLAQTHHNLGLTYRAMDQPEKAAEHFDRALRYAGVDSPDEVARSELEHALLLLFERDPDLASVRAARALERYEAYGDRAGVGEAERVLGLVALGRRDEPEAKRHLRAAERIAEELELPLLEAECLEGGAALERSRHRPETAEDLEARAETIFTRLGASAWGRHIRWRSRQVAGLPSASPEA